MKIMTRTLLYCVLAMSAACTAVGPGQPVLDEKELLSGAAFGVSEQGDPPISRAAAFEVDDTMRAFVEAETGHANHQRAKLFTLLEAMKEIDLFALDYEVTTTYTPPVTFRERQGNCLSATMLFVALAREAGLDVEYQLVNVPPTWSDAPDILVISNHVNARVTPRNDREYVVDFNEIGYNDRMPSREIDDDYVLALFYNNLGAEALIRKDYALSFRYFRAGIEADSMISAIWSNLGVLYARQGFDQHAEAAYLQALASRSRNRTALTNLVNLYEARGDHATAQLYREQVRRYQERNPYYHFALAERAYSEQRLDDALAAVSRAIRLKGDEQRFHQLRGQTYLALGRESEAEKSFARAAEYAEPAATSVLAAPAPL
jgi:tetratricopeptide (TPR) repeat protein